MNPDSPPPPPPPPASSYPQLAAFLTAETPRRDIPPKLLRETYAQIAPLQIFNAAATLLLCGVLLCVFLLVALTPFAVLRDDALTKRYATAPGVVISATDATAWTDTLLSKGRQTVYGFSFKFTPANATGAQASGVTGVCYADRWQWMDGGQVTVEYDPDNAAHARIQGARLARTGIGKIGLLAGVPALLMLGLGLLGLRKYFSKRAYSRWLLKNGAVDEFTVEGMEVVRRRRRRERTEIIFVYQLKPANRNDDPHSYYSPLTKKNQTAYADAVMRSKATTFGLFDPTARGDRCHVLMVESWFYDTED